MDAPIDPRFGRCTYFVIVDTDTMKSEVFPNASQTASSGAGIQAAQTIVNKGAKLVLTGSVGPNAHQVLSASGIEVITGVDGTVQEAIRKYKNSQLRDATMSQNPAMRDKTGKGFGMGLGQGRGLGRGRGMGFRRWQATGPITPTSIDPSPIHPTSTKMSKEQKIQALEKQMESLQQQMKQITKQLKALKK
jgi:predicted Fe-Mo cluster-binding NifX family protein